MVSYSHSYRTTIAAPAATIQALIADFHAWTRWSPWEGLDPDLQRTYEGSGLGATYAWSGNRKAGQGSMRFVAVEPLRVAADLEFVKPFKASNLVTFWLTPGEQGTEVEWVLAGTRNVALELMGRLFFDRVIGKDFQRGLAQLKAVAEDAPATGE